MDFFTHLLISTLVYDKLDVNYLFPLALFTGIFPDLDIFLIPLSNKYSWANHHGPTHSFFFSFCSSVIVAFSYSQIKNGIFIDGFFVAFTCSLTHVLLDLFTSWSVPVLWPVYRKKVKYDLDRAVNPYLAVVSVGFMWILYYYWDNVIDYVDSLLLITALFFILYFLFRLVLRLYLETKYKTRVLPTSSPFTWFLVNRTESEEKLEVKYAKYSLLSQTMLVFNTFELFWRNQVNNLERPEDAINYSKNLSEVKLQLQRFKYPFARAERTKTGIWNVYWYPVEMIIGNRAIALKIALKPNGNYSVKTVFLKLN